MNLIKEVLLHEVYPALGCTEPISCAFAAATAAEQLDEPVERFALRIDPGTYKNGAAVTVPHAEGEKGNLVAAALGAMLARSDAKLELLRHVTPEILERARHLLATDRCRCDCLEAETDFRVEVIVSGRRHRAVCILAGSHTHIERIEKDGSTIHDGVVHTDTASTPHAYRKILRNTDLQTLLSLVDRMDADDHRHLRKGIDMNMAAAEAGLEEGHTARQLHQLHQRGFIAADIFYRAKLHVASAVDRRMSGGSQPVMTSGGSGNQGIVAILTPVLVGREIGTQEERIVRSLAVSHLINAYVKCFVGELSAICGCTMAAGMAAAAAIVYQEVGVDMAKIAPAIHNVIGDLSGLICDGAKPGCAMKAVTGVDTAIRSALMALQGYGVAAEEGVVGQTAEDSIRNLARITLEGMFQVDPTVLKIIREKTIRRGKA